MAEITARLALDTYVLAQGIKTGVYRVCDELYPRLVRSSRLRSRMYFRDAPLPLTEILTRKFAGLLHCAPADRPGDDADILLSPFGEVPALWRNDPRVLHAHIVYDLIAIHHPEYFTDAGASEVRRIIDSLDRETIVFAISECTKRDLLTYRPDLDANRVVVIPLAASERFSPQLDEKAGDVMREKYGIPPRVPYVLSLATLEVRKNMDVLVQAFVQHLDAHPDSDLRLVLSGMSGWRLEGLRAALASAGRWRHRIILTGFVDDDDLSALYSQALAFCYLSRYEGFGLPPLEAMACGTPVVCADNSSLPEVVGDAGLLVGADDVDAVAESFQSLRTSPTLRANLSRASLERAKLFSWDRCADVVVDTLDEAFRKAATQRSQVSDIHLRVEAL